MAYYYSASERAFFSSEFMTVGEMPADKVAVADGTWKTLVADQSAGKIIRTGASNAPESAAQSLAALTGYAVPAGMTVAGGVSATGSISAGGAITAGGTLTVKGGASLASASVSGTMDVTGTTNLKSTLTVAGKTTAKAMSATDISASTITTTGNASVGGTLTATGAATLNNTLNVAGKSTLKAVSATGIDATTVDTTGNSSVGGTLTVKGNATVGGKNVARSVDGVAATANGDVPLNAMAYKKLSSIQSVKGSFLFDSLSGIATSEIPAAALNGDWVGVQFGMSTGSDKTQIVMQGYEWFYRTADQNLGQENWSNWERFDPRYTAQNYLKLDGTNTMTGTIKSSVANGSWVGAANGQTVINSTAVDGAFVPLWQYESTSGGSFVLGGYKDAFTVTYISNESKASNTNTREWTLTLNEQGVLSVPSDLLITGKLKFREAGGRDAAYVQPSAVAEQYDFVLAGANQATFICSGECGYATEEMKAFRDSLRVGGEDIVLASDNNIVLAANCNTRDSAVVKKAVLQTNGLFTLPVHPVADSNDYSAATTKWVRDLVQAAVPTGTILPFDGTNVPSGYLVCNGAAVSRTTYAALFAVLGTRHGEGDGKTTFNLPNAHRRFLEMTTTTSEVGETVEAGLPNITGQFRAQGSPDGRTRNSGAFANDGKGRIDGGLSNGGDYEDLRSFNASRCSALYGGSSTVQPPSLRALAIIKF